MGYKGDGITCEDVDECEVRSNCHAFAQCTNLDGGYECACSSGYTGNGTLCEDVNECLDSNLTFCPNKEQCLNLEGTFSCDGLTGNW